MRKSIVNTCLTTLCVALSCLAVPACNVMADQKPLPPAGVAQAFSEKGLLGDWQQQVEGWRIRLNGDHSAAVYFEGVYESPPSFTTWKLVGSHVILGNASLLKSGMFENLGGDFIVIPSQGNFVMSPKKELPVAEKRGFAACSCLWHSNRKVNIERK